MSVAGFAAKSAIEAVAATWADSVNSDVAGRRDRPDEVRLAATSWGRRPEHTRLYFFK